jgi:hypothetical protein
MDKLFTEVLARSDMLGAREVAADGAEDDQVAVPGVRIKHLDHPVESVANLDLQVENLTTILVIGPHAKRENRGFADVAQNEAFQEGVASPRLHVPVECVVERESGRSAPASSAERASGEPMTNRACAAANPRMRFESA